MRTTEGMWMRRLLLLAWTAASMLLAACGGGGGGDDPPPGGEGGGSLTTQERTAAADRVARRMDRIAGNAPWTPAALEELRAWAATDAAFAEVGVEEKTFWARFTDGRY